MANTFKVVTFAAEPASAGTAYKMYTVAGSTTTVVLGLILTNIHTTAVTVEVELVKAADAGIFPMKAIYLFSYYVISIMESVPETLSATEQSIFK